MLHQALCFCSCACSTEQYEPEKDANVMNEEKERNLDLKLFLNVFMTQIRARQDPISNSLSPPNL